MSICSDFCDMMETIFEDLDELLEDTCLAGRDKGADNNVKKTPEPGDIIGVDRGIYQHYGVYAGDNRVIHYTAETSDLDPENAEVQETSLERFLRDETDFFILEGHEITGDIGAPHEDDANAPRLFSPEETVERARARMGERNYNLIANNCEHFVVWCKTGVSDSRQVRTWVALCRRTVSYINKTTNDAA